MEEREREREREIKRERAQETEKYNKMSCNTKIKRTWSK